MHTAKTSDVLIIGAGVLGLTAAWYARQAGLTVTVLEADAALAPHPRGDSEPRSQEPLPRHLGGRASDTPLGALMPHTTNGWSAKKQYQFDALLSLPGFLDALGAAAKPHNASLARSGRELAGYRRCGRVLPIRTPHFRAHCEKRAAASADFWARDENGAATGLAMSILAPSSASDQPPVPTDWLDPGEAPLGVVYDPLAACIDAAAYRALLLDAVSACGARLIAGTRVTNIAGKSAVVTCADASRYACDRIIVSAGAASFALLRDALAADLGFGVAGEAALYRVKGRDLSDLPIIYDDGTYVVPHGRHHVAVGSTSQRTDATRAMPAKAPPPFLERAPSLCPLLRGLTPDVRWAGVRPKTIEREPMSGPWPEAPRVVLLTGGFKITLGIAHRLAAATVAEMLGHHDAAPLVSRPERYAAAHHHGEWIERGRCPSEPGPQASSRRTQA